MAFFGDLIVPDMSIVEATERFTAAQAQAGLAQLGPVAEQLRLSELWTQLQWAGTDREQFPAPAGTRIGTSIAFASVAGAGFWQPEPFSEASAEQLRARAGSSTPARVRYERQMDAIRQRDQQRAALRRIVAAAGTVAPFSLRALLSIDGAREYTFGEGYVRRIAYLLAFEASLNAASLAPFNDRLVALVSGTPDELYHAFPPVETPAAFSIYLNVSAYLDGLVAHESDMGEPHPLAGASIRALDAKRRLLAEGRAAAAQAREPRLHADARLALHALDQELELVQRVGLRFEAMPPLWGRDAILELR